jgi:hypothetical protein
MNDLARLEIALQIEDVSRKLEEVMAEQNQIIGELLQSIQNYVEEVSGE